MYDMTGIGSKGWRDVYLVKKGKQEDKKRKKGSKKCFLKCPFHVKFSICMRIYFLQLANRRNDCIFSLIIS